MRKIINEVAKHLKLIFRSWSSLGLLVLAPLLLILLLGYAFSGQTLHDIRLGYVLDGDLNPIIIQNISGLGYLEKYSSAEACVEALRTEQVHLCLELSGPFFTLSNITIQHINASQITFYYDNSNQYLGETLSTKVREYFGVQTQEYSIGATSTIFSAVSDLVVYLADRNTDLKDLRNETITLRETLVARGERLNAVYTSFLGPYTRVKGYQVQLNSSMQSYLGLSSSFQTDLTLLREELHALSQVLDVLEFSSSEHYFFVRGQNNTLLSNASALANLTTLPINLSSISDFTEYEDEYGLFTIYNLSHFLNASTLSNETIIVRLPDRNVTVMLDQLPSDEQYSLLRTLTLMTLEDAETRVTALQNATILVDDEIRTFWDEIDRTVGELDAIKLVLEDEIRFNDQAIKEVDRASAEIVRISENLDESLKGLSVIDPDLAESIIKPFQQSIVMLLPGVTGIQALFPALLTAVIIFSSILFATVVTHAELHNVAALRNRITPASSGVWFAGLLIINLMVALFQVLILLYIAHTRFMLPILQELPLLLALSAIEAILFVLVGMLIAVSVKNQQSSVLLATFVALGFFLFSNVIGPLEAMPALGSHFAGLNPMVIGSTIVRGVLLLDVPAIFYLPEFILLASYAALLLGITYILFAWQRNR